MMLPPAVILRGAEESALLPRTEALTLLSPRGAGGFAGARWWLALLAEVRARHPRLAAYPFLDCAEDGAAALEAIRQGVPGLILNPGALGFAECAALCRREGIFLLHAAPPAFDPLHAAFRRGRSGPKHSGRGRAPHDAPPHDR